MVAQHHLADHHRLREAYLQQSSSGSALLLLLRCGSCEEPRLPYTAGSLLQAGVFVQHVHTFSLPHAPGLVTYKPPCASHRGMHRQDRRE